MKRWHIIGIGVALGILLFLAYPASAAVNETASLKFLGYNASSEKVANKEPALAVEAFQRKERLNPTGVLNKETRQRLAERAGDMRIPSKCSGRDVLVLCASKKHQTVFVVDPVDGHIDSLQARFGGPGHRTREGIFPVTRKGGANHISTLYGVEMPYPIFFSGGQAIHFSHAFSADSADDESHGCVGTRDLEAQKAIWEASKVGETLVVVVK